MSYKILADSKALYEFADEKTRKSVFDAVILKGKTTDYHFEGLLNIHGQTNITDNDLSSDNPLVLTVGGKLFIAQSVKTIFEKHEVNGEYFEARVMVNGVVNDEPYYLFNPLIGIDCLDYKNATYHKAYDDWSKLYNISKISPLKIDESKILDSPSLFFLGQFPNKENENRILDSIILIRLDLAKELLQSKLSGITIFGIEDYDRSWKWQ